MCPSQLIIVFTLTEHHPICDEFERIRENSKKKQFCLKTIFFYKKKFIKNSYVTHEYDRGHGSASHRGPKILAMPQAGAHNTAH
jgi:hypothetical protein